MSIKAIRATELLANDLSVAISSEGTSKLKTLYVWKKPNITVQVGTDFFGKAVFEGGLREIPSSIIVDGTDGTIGRTWRGLKLGDPYRAIAEIYGSRYVKEGRLVTIQWKTTTTLEIGWNKQDVINHIGLFGDRRVRRVPIDPAQSWPKSSSRAAGYLL